MSAETTQRWTRHRLGRLFLPISITGHADADVLSVYRDYGVIPKNSRTDNFNRTPENLGSYQLVHPGDLVVNRMKAWQGSLGVSGYRGIVSPDYEVLRPTTAEVHPRFVHALLRSRHLIGEYGIRSTGIRPSQWRLYWDQMKLIEVALPCLAEQRAVADYLDRETAQIDALIGKQERLIETLRERRDAMWAGLVDQATVGAPLLPLRRLIRSIVDGPFGSSLTSSHYVAEGVRVIRLGNIGINEFKGKDAAYVSESHGADLSAHAAIAGDVVIAGLGDERMPLGRAAVVPDDLGPAVVKADCFRARPTSAVSGAYLAWSLSSPQARTQMRLMSRGSTRARLNTSVVREVVLPVPTRERQDAVLTQSAEQTAKIDALIAKAERFIEVSKERRSALITAAVTGQIDVRDRVGTAGAQSLASTTLSEQQEAPA